MVPDITVQSGLFVSMGLWGYQLEALEYKLKACIISGQALFWMSDTLLQGSQYYLQGLYASRSDL